MKALQRFFDFYLDASVHVAFAVLSLVHVTYITLNITVDIHLCWFLFFSSISCYNFIKYGVEAEKYIVVANSYQRGIQFLSFLCLLIAGYHAYFLNFETYSGIAVLLILTGIYALPVLPVSKNLRSWGGLKIFVVALVWSAATVVLPILSNDLLFSWDFGVEAFQRFLFILVLMIPFEIRDLSYDAPELKTLPQRYGVANTKIFGAFMTLLFFVTTFLKDDIGRSELIAKGLAFLSLGVLMFVTKRNQPKYFASFLVESIPIVYCVVLLALIQWVRD
jgi:hypothetical protein